MNRYSLRAMKIAAKYDTKQLWQDYMDSAYEKWRNDVNLQGQPYETFATALERNEKVAVMLGNLNSQVHNGGFLQWIDNKYAKVINDVIVCLNAIPGSGVKEVMLILLMIKPYISYDPLSSVSGINDRYMDFDGNTRDEVIEDLREADERFYAINDQFMDEVGAWLLLKTYGPALDYEWDEFATEE